MDTNRLREIIEYKKTLDINDPAIMDCWKKEAELLSENVSETISFIDNECTDDEFYWLCEVFDDVISKTQSRELLRILIDRNSRVKDPEQRESNMVDLNFAKDSLD